MDNRRRLDPARIRARLEALGLSPRAASIEAVGTPDFIRHLLSGHQRDTTMERAEALARVLKCSVPYLYGATDDVGDDLDHGISALVIRDSAPAAVPEYDVRVSAGPGSFVDGERVRREWGVPKRFLEDLGVPAKDAAFVEVLGDSMSPRLQNGDLVLIDRRSKRMTPGAIYALWDGEATVCKRLEPVTAEQVRIVSENPAYPPYTSPASAIHIIGRVAWFGRRV